MRIHAAFYLVLSEIIGKKKEAIAGLTLATRSGKIVRIRLKKNAGS